MPSKRLIVAILIGTLVPATVALSQAVERKGFFDQQHKASRENALQRPLLKQHKIDDIFRIRLETDQLLIEAMLEPERELEERRAELQGISEPAIIVCHFTSQDLGQVEFTFELDDFSDPTTFAKLSIRGLPGGNDGKQIATITIEKTWQTPRGLRRVFLNQTASAIQMEISSNGGEPGGSMDQNFVEKDFASLRRRHHAEVEQWLRPIFHEIHQEGIFGADPATAWQVLAPHWPVDEKLKQAISGKIAALDSDDFRVRRRTADELEKLGRDAALVMMRMDRTGLSDEQNLRLDEVIARFKPVSDAEARRLRNDPNFLLDCLYGEDETARRLALDQLRVVLNKPIEFDVGVDEVQRVKAVNALREKLIPPETQAKQ